MERVRETAVTILMLFLLLGILAIAYSLLIWQVLPKTLAMVLLFSLALLKGIVASLRNYQAAQELNCQDTRIIKLVLLSILSVFLIIVFISYVLQSQQLAAAIVFIISLLIIKKTLDFLPAD